VAVPVDVEKITVAGYGLSSYCAAVADAAIITVAVSAVALAVMIVVASSGFYLFSVFAEAATIFSNVHAVIMKDVKRLL